MRNRQEQIELKEDVTGNMEMYKNVKGGGQRVAWLDNVKMYAMLWVILGELVKT